MKNTDAAQSGAEPDEASDIAIRLRVLAGEIYNMQTSLDWLERQLFADTADSDHLELLAAQRGLERNAAVCARGNLRFSISDTKTTEVIIPSGTAVATNSDSPVLICTTEDSSIPPGSLSVSVPARAEQAGYRGNIRVGTAVVPVSVPAEIDSVTNPSVFSGGADAESDASLRERIRKSYLNQPNGMNAEYYIKLAKSVEGVAKAGVIAKQRGAGTVNVYVGGHSGALSNDKLGEVQQALDRERELNVDVLAVNAYPYSCDLEVTVIPKAGYENTEVTDKITAAFEDYLSSIDVGGRFYLSALGRRMLDTGCIENYEYDLSMQNRTASGNQYFVPGDVTIEVSTP